MVLRQFKNDFENEVNILSNESSVLNINNDNDNDNENNFKKNKKYKYKYRKDTCCSNCGKNGHIYRECVEPITSFGIVLISISTDYPDIINKLIEKFKTNKDNQYTITDTCINIYKQNDIELFCKYMILLI